MYTYYMKIYLDNGSVLYGWYKGDEVNTTEVSQKLFNGVVNTVNGITSMTGSNLFFNISHVVAFEIDLKPINKNTKANLK